MSRRVPTPWLAPLEGTCRLRRLSPPTALSEGALARRARGAEGLLCFASDRVGRKVLSVPGLKVVATASTGVDHVDLAEARRRGIPVGFAPGVLVDAVAELTWGLILAVARRLPEADHHVRAGRFTGWAPELFLGQELRGRTLGIVGWGRIGRAVARRARGFGMRVVWTDPRPAEAASRAQARRPFRALLREADVVSLHVPLTPATRHLISRVALAAMRPGAILINTSRGPVVDEAALVQALAGGRLAGAGLDVYEEEPRVHPGLIRSARAVLLPHIGSATAATRRRMVARACANLLAFFAGRRLPHRAA